MDTSVEENNSCNERRSSAFFVDLNLIIEEEKKRERIKTIEKQNKKNSTSLFIPMFDDEKPSIKGKRKRKKSLKKIENDKLLNEKVEAEKSNEQRRTFTKEDFENFQREVISACSNLPEKQNMFSVHHSTNTHLKVEKPFPLPQKIKKEKKKNTNSQKIKSKKDSNKLKEDTDSKKGSKVNCKINCKTFDGFLSKKSTNDKDLSKNTRKTSSTENLKDCDKIKAKDILKKFKKAHAQLEVLISDNKEAENFDDKKYTNGDEKNFPKLPCWAIKAVDSLEEDFIKPFKYPVVTEEKAELDNLNTLDLMNTNKDKVSDQSIPDKGHPLSIISKNVNIFPSVTQKETSKIKRTPEKTVKEVSSSLETQLSDKSCTTNQSSPKRKIKRKKSSLSKKLNRIKMREDLKHSKLKEISSVKKEEHPIQSDKKEGDALLGNGVQSSTVDSAIFMTDVSNNNSNDDDKNNIKLDIETSKSENKDILITEIDQNDMLEKNIKIENTQKYEAAKKDDNLNKCIDKLQKVNNCDSSFDSFYSIVTDATSYVSTFDTLCDDFDKDVDDSRKENENINCSDETNIDLDIDIPLALTELHLNLHNKQTSNLPKDLVNDKSLPLFYNRHILSRISEEASRIPSTNAFTSCDNTVENAREANFNSLPSIKNISSPSIDNNLSRNSSDLNTFEKISQLIFRPSAVKKSSLSIDSNCSLNSSLSSLPDISTSRPYLQSVLGNASFNSAYSGSTSSSKTSQLTKEDVIEWQKGKVIDKGAFGTVYQGLTNKAQLIAVKEVDVGNCKNALKMYTKLKEEVAILKGLRHKNIIKFIGTTLEDTSVYIFMEYIAGGSISSLIVNFGPLNESIYKRFTKQIIDAVVYIHKQGVIHRDIKGGNIVITVKGIIKLIDFGCAKSLSLSLGNTNLLKSVKGTPYWMSPEVIKGTGCNHKSDIWSIGCTVIEMAEARPPWSQYDPYAAMFTIAENSTVPPKLDQKHSEHARSFVEQCLTRDMTKRPSADDLKAHPFICI